MLPSQHPLSLYIFLLFIYSILYILEFTYNYLLTAHILTIYPYNIISHFPVLNACNVNIVCIRHTLPPMQATKGIYISIPSDCKVSGKSPNILTQDYVSILSSNSKLLRNEKRKHKLALVSHTHKKQLSGKPSN